jgi:hypothetical protein
LTRVNDLNDTVDYHGFALVSSAGGSGRLGDWHKEDTDGTVDVTEELADAHSVITNFGGSTLSGSLMSGPLLTKQPSIASPQRLTGNERIQVAEEVRQRVASPGRSPSRRATLEVQSDPTSPTRTTRASSAASSLAPPSLRPRRTISTLSRRSSSASHPAPPAVPQENAIREELIREHFEQPKPKTVKDQEAAEANDLHEEEQAHTKNSLLRRLLARSSIASIDYA